MRSPRPSLSKCWEYRHDWPHQLSLVLAFFYHHVTNSSLSSLLWPEELHNPCLLKANSTSAELKFPCLNTNPPSNGLRVYFDLSILQHSSSFKNQRKIQLTHVVNPNLRNSSVAQADLELKQFSCCFNLNSLSYRCVMPSQNLGECFRNPKTSQSSVKVTRWLVAYDSKPSTGRNRAGWLWGSWVQSQAELHIQTPLSSLEPGMVTHNDNLGTGEAERKRRIAKSLSYSGNCRPARATEYRPAPPPTPPSKFKNTNL